MKLSELDKLPADPILGLIALYREDASPDKVDLGVGVYQDENGRTPVLSAVKQAESWLLDNEDTKAYIGPAGLPSFNDSIEVNLFGENHSVRRDGRVCTAQTAGGCGGLRIAAELVLRAQQDARIWVSDPTWPNHLPLLGGAGVELSRYPYYDAKSHALDFEGMRATLTKAAPGDLVLLHGSCHNPSGADPSREQWDAIAQLCTERSLVPFVDMAYQGFAHGLAEDAYGVRVLANSVPEMIVVSSCSKNFGLYRERTGTISVVADTSQAALSIATQINSVTRGNYSMPPSHGAAIVSHVLGDPGLRSQWENELAEMRNRLNDNRRHLADALQAHTGRDYAFFSRENGMFSFLGIDAEQVKRLREEHHVYVVGDSRINVAGINAANLDYVASAVASVASA
jgi:aspartate aminotransferase